MPQQDYNTNLGFNVFPQNEPAAQTPTEPSAGVFDLARAGLNQENAVYNFVDLVTRSHYEPDPTFNLVESLKKHNLWDDRENYIGVQSENEMLAAATRIKGDKENDRTLNSAGWSGIAARILMGSLDPTIFLPLAGEGRGIRAVAEGAALGFTGAALDESVLQTAQETRSAGQSAFGVGAATVLGGILGGAHAYLTRPLDEVAKDFVTPKAVSTVGAAAAVEPAGGLKAGAPSVLSRIGPVTATIDQTDSLVASSMMQQLSDAGLRMEHNVSGTPTTPGGTVENRVKTWYGPVKNFIETFDQEYSNHWFGDSNPRILANQRAKLGGALRLGVGKLSKHEFSIEVSRALREGDQHEIPEVAKVAAFVRSTVLDPMWNEAKAVGMVKGEAGPIGDVSYLHRDYNNEVISRRFNEFVNVLSAHFEQKLGDEFAQKAQKLNVKMAKVKQQVEDINLPEEQAKILRQEIADKVKKEYVPSAAEDDIGDLREKARLAKAAGATEEAKAFLKQARELQTPEVKVRGEERRGLKARLRNLDKNKFVREAKVREKLDKIDSIEEATIGSLEKLIRDGQRFIAKLETLTDDELDAQVEKLNEQFDKISKSLDKTETKLKEVVGDGTIKYLETRGKGIQYHGTSEVALQPSSEHYSSGNYYGPGFYTTDAADIAHGYSKKSNTGERNVYTVTHNRPLNILNGENPVPQNVKALLEGQEVKTAGDGIILDSLEESKNLREFYDNIRENATGENYTRDDVQELFETVNEKLRKLGYDGFSHVGGLKTNNAPHNVTVYFNPEKDITVKKGNIEDFRDLSSEDKILNLWNRAVASNSKLDSIFQKLQHAEGLDREETRNIVQRGMDEAVAQVADINSRRTLRVQKLHEQADALDPKLVEEETKRLQDSLKEHGAKLTEATRLGGGENIDLEKGTAEFGKFAKEISENVAHKILGTELRIPGLDIIAAERGPEFARVLDLPSSAIEQFLENDVERLVKKYVRTLAPDIELTRKFGSPNAVEQFRQLTDEQNRALEGAVGDAASKKIFDKFGDYRQNLEAVIGRLRHTWGIPKDARSWAVRGARVAMNLNVARLMGGVVISSIPDIGRPIMRYGMLNVFRDGLVPMVTNFKGARISQREAKLAGTALDPLIHTRAHQMFDVLDEFGRGNRAERTLEYVTSRIGLIGLFDYWTSAGKQFTAGVSNAMLLRAVQDVVEGKAAKKSLELLASTGIDGTTAEKIWKEVQDSGGGRIRGAWLPNTEAWKDANTIRAYRAALVKEVDDTIITPGVERPLWVDRTMAGRLIAQFRSFGLTSVTKTVMAGLQQRDAAALNGAVISVSLGMLSYYLYARAVGGIIEQQMENASLGQWVDEGIDRSGILGSFSDLQRVLEKLPILMSHNVPGTNLPVRTLIGRFSDKRVTRGEGQDLVGAVAGQSFDLAEKVASIAMGIDDPTKGTLHNIRTVLPYQNLFWLRWGLDKVEQNSGLPVKR